MRVLITNKIRPILLIAFTNHALDHLLSSAMDSGATTKVARLGSRSNDARIAEFSLENLERADPAQGTDKGSMGKRHAILKDAEKDLKKLLDKIHHRGVPESDIRQYLLLFYPVQLGEFENPPKWVTMLRTEQEGWTEAGAHKSSRAETVHEFWVRCRDIEWMEASSQHQAAADIPVQNAFAPLSIEETDTDDEDLMTEATLDEQMETEEQLTLRLFLEEAGLENIPSVPNLNRPLEDLRNDVNVWLMSRRERKRLEQFWTSETRSHFLHRHRGAFKGVKEKYELAKREHEECRDQVKIEFCSSVRGSPQ